MIFFPERGSSTVIAKKICSECKVKEECLEYAVERKERFGIWGGKSERERRAIRRERRNNEKKLNEFIFIDFETTGQDLVGRYYFDSNVLKQDAVQIALVWFGGR